MSEKDLLKAAIDLSARFQSGGGYTPDFSIVDNQEKVEIGTDGVNVGKIILSDRENIDFNGYMSKYSYEDSLKDTLNKISGKQK